TPNLKPAGTDSGSFNTAVGATILFPLSPTFNGSSFSGAGQIRLTSGTYTLNGTITSPILEFAGATITGTFTLNGTFSWTSGPLMSGARRVAEDSVFSISAAGTKTRNSGFVLNNADIVNWRGK